MAVIDLDRIGLRQRLALRQEIGGVVRYREGPADRAGNAAFRIRRQRRREDAE
jgi:hypothetical protein